MPVLSIVVSVLVFALSLWPVAPIVPQASVATASPIPRGDMRFGIHPNPDAADNPPAGVFGVERIWDTGVTWCRLNPAPGVWDFSPLVSQLEAAARRGAGSAIVVLGFPPPHAGAGVANPAEAGWMCPQPGYASILPPAAAWDEYVQLTVAQVAAWRSAHPDVVVHFQVWNEPGVLWFLGEGQQPARLRPRNPFEPFGVTQRRRLRGQLVGPRFAMQGAQIGGQRIAAGQGRIKNRLDQRVRPMADQCRLERAVQDMEAAQKGAIADPIDLAAQQRRHESASLGLAMHVGGFGLQAGGQTGHRTALRGTRGPPS